VLGSADGLTGGVDTGTEVVGGADVCGGALVWCVVGVCVGCQVLVGELLGVQSGGVSVSDGVASPVGSAVCVGWLPPAVY
jgi:hypothetical protein